MVYSQPKSFKRIGWTPPTWAAVLGGVFLVAILVFGSGRISEDGVATVQSEAPQSYIVQGKSLDSVKDLVSQHAGEITSELEIINGVGVLLTPADAAKLAEMDGVTVTPNHNVVTIQSADGAEDQSAFASTGWNPAAEYSDVVNADVAWDQGVTGDNLTVAILDTGINPEIEGLARDTAGNERLIIKKKANFIDEKALPLDDHGHGTHIAGIIASSEADAEGDWMGVAPDVNLMPIKVLNADGAGTYESVIEGIQYAVKKRNKHNIRVINLSLVSTVQSPYWADPLNQAATHAWSKGIVVVAAAGNGGPDAMTISVPGNNPYVITVGAFTDNFTPEFDGDDYIAPFSASGPTLDGFVKPDVMAPGAHIYSVMGADTTLANAYPENFYEPNHFAAAGTSQATAVTTGVIALMLDHNQDERAEYKVAIKAWRETPKSERNRDEKPARVKKLGPDEIKFRLMESSQVWIDAESNEPVYSIWQQGFGRVDAAGAVFSTAEGEANGGMDIKADLEGEVHYEGFSFYDDESGLFLLYEDPTNGGFGTWAGGFGTWAGSYTAWDGNYSPETGGFGTWAGGFGTWAGGFGTWAGGFGTWAGGFGTWAGGFGTWAGGFGTWAGGFGTWAGAFGDPAFAANFVEGHTPNTETSSASVGTQIDYRD